MKKTYKICEFIDNRGIKYYKIKAHDTIFGLISYSYYEGCDWFAKSFSPFGELRFLDKEKARSYIDILVHESQPVTEELIGCEDYP